MSNLIYAVKCGDKTGVAATLRLALERAGIESGVVTVYEVPKSAASVGFNDDGDFLTVWAPEMQTLAGQRIRSQLVKTYACHIELKELTIEMTIYDVSRQPEQEKPVSPPKPAPRTRAKKS